MLAYCNPGRGIKLFYPPDVTFGILTGYALTLLSGEVESVAVKLNELRRNRTKRMGDVDICMITRAEHGTIR